MKILLADDHTLFRDALVEYMRRASEGNEILIAEDFYQAEKLLGEETDIDLVLLDFKMPGMNGLEGLKKIKENHPNAAVALISGVAEERHVKQAMELGARGFFPKTLSGKAMMKAIDLVMMGEKFLPVDHRSNLLQPSYYGDKDDNSFHDTPAAGNLNAASHDSAGLATTGDGQHMGGNLPNLTRREREVLGFLTRGASNKDIARALDLQIVTIKLHVRGICKKLNAKNRTQAALIAQKEGLVDQ